MKEMLVRNVVILLLVEAIRPQGAIHAAPPGTTKLVVFTSNVMAKYITGRQRILEEGIVKIKNRLQNLFVWEELAFVFE